MEEKNRLPSASNVSPNRLPPPSQNSSNRFEQRMESPDGLLELDPADVVARRAPGDAVEPAVRAPGEVIDQRLGVLHAEAGEQDLGLAVGHVVAVAVGVEQEVGHLEDVDAAVAERQPRAEVQTGDEVREAVGPAVAVGVLADRDPVGALRAPWVAVRALAVIDGPRPAVHLHALRARRESGIAGTGSVQSRPRSSNLTRIGWRTLGSAA